MRIRSFEEFLTTKNVSVYDIRKCVDANGNSLTFNNCTKENHCYGLTFSSILVFSENPIFTTREWMKINEEWNQIKQEVEGIPFWSDREPLGKLNDKKFNEELL